MKILLDNCVTHELRPLLSGHEVVTAKYAGWDQLKNGELLVAAAGANFDAMITVDRNLPHQQRAPLPIAVVLVVVPSNRIEDIEPLVSQILQTLASLPPRTVVEVRR